MSIFDRFGQCLGRFWGGFGEGLEEVLGGSGSILGAFGCFWGALGRLLGPFCWVLLGSGGFCCVLVGSAVFWWVLLGSAGF